MANLHDNSLHVDYIHILLVKSECGCNECIMHTDHALSEQREQSTPIAQTYKTMSYTARLLWLAIWYLKSGSSAAALK